MNNKDENFELTLKENIIIWSALAILATVWGILLFKFPYAMSLFYVAVALFFGTSLIYKARNKRKLAKVQVEKF